LDLRHHNSDVGILDLRHLGRGPPQNVNMLDHRRYKRKQGQHTKGPK
jgi:hypothetical protein